MRYLKTKAGRVHFLKPKERFETDSCYLRIDSDTSVRRYVWAIRRGMKFISTNRINPTGHLTSLLRGFRRSNFLNEHYDDHYVYSSRKLWFFRNPQADRFEPDFVWDLGSKRTKTKMRWGTC